MGHQYSSFPKNARSVYILNFQRPEFVLVLCDNRKSVIIAVINVIVIVIIKFFIIMRGNCSKKHWFTVKIFPLVEKYRIALNFGGAKLRQIWQIAFLLPNITLQNSPNYALWFAWCSFCQSLTLQNFYGDLFAKVWHHQSLALYGMLLKLEF